MAYDKGTYIDGYKVSILLKAANGIETYRVRDTDGRLRVLKLGSSEMEQRMAHCSELFVSRTDRYTLYRYVNGETLAARLLRIRHLDEAEVTEITTDILLQLESFHKQGIAHCNISPENVVIDMSTDKEKAYLVGLSHLTKAMQNSVVQDLVSLGQLINTMLSGDCGVIVRANAGNMSLLETVMMKAIHSEFPNASEMLQALQGKRTVKYTYKASGTGFSAVAGMSQLKEQLRTEVLDILADKEEAARYGIDIPNGLLLYGPPGCGKTFLAERFAEEAGYNYKYVKSSDLASTYLHGSQEKIAALFDEARSNAPTILCFDEFDALVPKRDNINNASQSGEVNEFLSQLNNCGKDGVFIIATTNRPDKIDPAILRSGRIDYIVYVPLPDRDMRKNIFEMALTNRPHEDNINFDSLAKATEDFLASDISAIVQQAARLAFKSRSKISTDLLLSTIRTRKPSLSKSVLAEYDSIRDRFEGQAENKGWKHVGFSLD